MPLSLSLSSLSLASSSSQAVVQHDSELQIKPLPESLNLTLSNLALNLATKTETKKRWELGIFCVGKELSEEEDGDTWKDDAETGEEPVLKKNSVDTATTAAAAAEDDVFGFPAQPPSVREFYSRIMKRGILSSLTPLPPRDLLQQESRTSPALAMSCWRASAAIACSARVQSRLQCFVFFFCFWQNYYFWQKRENFNSF